MNTMPEELLNLLANARLPDDGVVRTLSEALAKMAEVKARIVAEYLRKQEKPAMRIRTYRQAIKVLRNFTLNGAPHSARMKGQESGHARRMEGYELGLNVSCRYFSCARSARRIAKYLARQAMNKGQF